MHKMMEKKCYANETKNILGYKRGKIGRKIKKKLKTNLGC